MNDRTTKLSDDAYEAFVEAISRPPRACNPTLGDLLRHGRALLKEDPMNLNKATDPKDEVNRICTTLLTRPEVRAYFEDAFASLADRLAFNGLLVEVRARVAPLIDIPDMVASEPEA